MTAIFYSFADATDSHRNSSSFSCFLIEEMLFLYRKKIDIFMSEAQGQVLKKNV